MDEKVGSSAGVWANRRPRLYLGHGGMCTDFRGLFARHLHSRRVDDSRNFDLMIGKYVQVSITP